MQDHTSRDIFELEVSSIYFNAVMIVLCNFERKYNLHDCLQQSHYSSIFAPYTHIHTHAVQEAEEHISAEEMAEVMLKHTDEMRKLQQEYE